MLEIEIEEMKLDDRKRVLEIYGESIKSDDATYVETCPTWDEWDREHNKKCRIVAKANNNVIGFAVCSEVFTTPGYQGVGELSIYVDSRFRKKGIGFMLLKKMVALSEKCDQYGKPIYYTLQARIFTNNKASIRLHEKAGFRLIGMREKILKKSGIWRNVYVYERRSDIY